MNTKPLLPLVLAGLLCSALQAAAEAPQRILNASVVVTPDQADWVYELGEPVTFTIRVLSDGQPVEGAEVDYVFGPERFETGKGHSAVPAEGLTVKAGAMDVPGFLRCIATVNIDGRESRGLATVGYAPEQIQPTQKDPDDFDAFWAGKKAELAEIPITLTRTLVPDRCTADVNTYHVSFKSWGIRGQPDTFYGMLTEPVKPGKYPAVLQVPGAGVRPYGGNTWLAGRGAVVLEIGIHGIPVNLPQPLYDDLRNGALQGYPVFRLDDRDCYYYLRVYLECVRALDVLTEHPMWNGEDLVVVGGSQGGQLSIVTSGLDERVTGTVSNYPAFCDLTGYLHGRAGGWPHMMNEEVNQTADKIANTGYFDAVNFARRLHAPISLAWGFNDETCPPTTMYAAYNVIPAEKELWVKFDMGHSSESEFSRVFSERILKMAGIE